MMKSGLEQLRKRGQIDNINIDTYKTLSNEKLINNLHSIEAFERTIALRLLTQREYFNLENIRIIIDLLSEEKALYTRLEICQILISKILAAPLLFDFLGKIGNNQYDTLPSEASKKISYPLPRDIIARILGKMSVSIIPAMFIFLEKAKTNQEYEIIDAIGFQLFYHQEAATEERCSEIIACLERNINNHLIVWKCITCLSAFKSIQSISYLTHLKKIFCDDIILKEISRSIKIINNNQK